MWSPQFSQKRNVGCETFRGSRLNYEHYVSLLRFLISKQMYSRRTCRILKYIKPICRLLKTTLQEKSKKEKITRKNMPKESKEHSSSRHILDVYVWGEVWMKYEEKWWKIYQFWTKILCKIRKLCWERRNQNSQHGFPFLWRKCLRWKGSKEKLVEGTRTRAIRSQNSLLWAVRNVPHSCQTYILDLGILLKGCKGVRDEVAVDRDYGIE